MQNLYIPLTCVQWAIKKPGRLVTVEERDAETCQVWLVPGYDG
jgi:hypothetical protein